VSRYQKGKTNLDFTEARNSEWQWHQLGHMQVSTSLQTDMQVAVAQFFTGPMPFLPPNQQRQSTEGKCTLNRRCKMIYLPITTSRMFRSEIPVLLPRPAKFTICHQAAQYTSCSFGNIFATNRTKIIDLHNSEVSQ